MVEFQRRSWELERVWKHYVKTRKHGDVIEISWFGWGTMGFFSFLLLFALPIGLALLVGAWIKVGMPEVDQIPLIQGIGEPASLALALVSLYLVCAVLLNWSNRIIVTRQELRIRQGYVPYLVSFRRRKLPIASADRFEVVSQSHHGGNDGIDHATDDWVVLICKRGPNVRISGDLSIKAAHRLCEQLNNVLSWATASPRASSGGVTES